MDLSMEILVHTYLKIYLFCFFRRKLMYRDRNDIFENTTLKVLSYMGIFDLLNGVLSSSHEMYKHVFRIYNFCLGIFLLLQKTAFNLES